VTELTVFTPPLPRGERAGLWDKDVVEAFIGADPNKPGRYTEYEVAPTGERLDLLIDQPAKSLEWNSGFESAVRVNKRDHTWVTEVRIPLSALAEVRPAPGTRWRLNLYRHDLAHRVFLAWHPTATGSAHTPERFGWLVFGE
jgi:hypothetical protein